MDGTQPGRYFQPSQVYTITVTEDMSLDYLEFALIANDLPFESVNSIEIDGTQYISLKDILLEEDNLSSLHFKNASTAIWGGHDLPLYFYTFWTCMTTFKLTTNQTPFDFLYKIEAVLPIVLEMSQSLLVSLHHLDGFPIIARSRALT